MAKFAWFEGTIFWGMGRGDDMTRAGWFVGHAEMASGKRQVVNKSAVPG